MIVRNVEGLEIVPLVLDLRPVGGREAEAAHDVLQLFDRLRDRVQPTKAEGLAGDGDVEWRATYGAARRKVSTELE